MKSTNPVEVEVGLTRRRPHEDTSILTVLRNGFDRTDELYEHFIARFFTTKEARELRLVCQEFKDAVEVHPFTDTETRIGGKDVHPYNQNGPTGRAHSHRAPDKYSYPIKKCIKWFRKSFPAALSANVRGREDLRNEDLALLRGFTHLNLAQTDITGGLQNLRGIRSLDIAFTAVDPTELMHLRGIETLDVSYSGSLGTTVEVIEQSFTHLRGIRTLVAYYCRDISNKAADHLFPILAGIETVSVFPDVVGPILHKMASFPDGTILVL